MDEQATGPQLAAEALLATTGILQDEPIAPEQGRLARRLPKEWRDAVVDFLDQRKPCAFKLPPQVDTVDLGERLAQGIDADRRARLVSRLVDQDLAAAYVEALARAWSYLQGRWPVLTQDTPIGPRRLPLGRTEAWRLSSLVAVVDSPERVLDEMRMETLTSDQAAAFRACFPALYGMLKQIVWGELTRRYKDPERYDLAGRKEQVLRVLVGLPPQVSLSMAKPDQPKAPPPSVPKVDFTKIQSRAQELAAPRS